MTDRFFISEDFFSSEFAFGPRPNGRLTAEDIGRFFDEITTPPVEAIVRTMKEARRVCPTGGCWNPPREGLPTLDAAEEVLHLARKQRVWWNVARGLRLPLGRTLADAFEDRPGYSSGYWGNTPVPVGTSPHALQDWAWKVFRRASEILHPFCWSPSWEALEAAIVSHGLRRVGRVAVQVAAASLPQSVGGGLFSASRRGSNSASRLPGLRGARAVLINARGWKERPRSKEEGGAVFHAALVSGGMRSVRAALSEVRAVLEQDDSGPTRPIHGAPLFKIGPAEVRRAYISSMYAGCPVPVGSDLPYGGAVVTVFIGGRRVAAEDIWTTRHNIRLAVKRAIRQYRRAVAQ